MIPIQKNIEPIGLTHLRQRTIDAGLSAEDAYKRLKNPLKSEVRNSLVNEQGGLCAYCMCKIPRMDVEPHITPIIIEHMTARNPPSGVNRGQGLDYSNLVATCNGNRASHGNRTLADLTCDAHKENKEFTKVNPCKPETMATIFYSLDGIVDATDPDVKFDLTNILNLNCPSSPLIAERKAALDSIIADIGESIEEDLLQYCTQLWEAFHKETTSKTPYVGIVIWYLETIIKALTDT